MHMHMHMHTHMHTTCTYMHMRMLKVYICTASNTLCTLHAPYCAHCEPIHLHARLTRVSTRTKRTFQAWRTCGGWDNDDSPGGCATREAQVMSKARGWWRVAAQWPSRFVAKTDDDCFIDLPRLSALLRAMPTHQSHVYAGKIYYTSINGTSANQLGAMPCYSNHGATGALGARYNDVQACGGLRGPFPFASGPLELMSAPLRAWLVARTARAINSGLYSPEVNAQVEDAQLGWEISHHPSVDVLDLNFAMARTNVRLDFGDTRWHGFEGLAAHKVDTRDDMQRISAQLNARTNLSLSSDLSSDLCAALSTGERSVWCPGGVPRMWCAPWALQLSELETFPCCREWNLCVPPGQRAARHRAAAAAEAEKNELQNSSGSKEQEAVARWMRFPKFGKASEARGGLKAGFCAATNDPGDCERGNKGSFPDVAGGCQNGRCPALDWELLARRCVRRCTQCARCHYVSASLAWHDCSWFSELGCDLANLSSIIPGFRTTTVR